MNRQSKTKRGILIAVILACLIAVIGGTYARYTSSGTANAEVSIAKWNVKLNNQDISSETKTVDVALTFDNNEYVKDGKIAPGRTGHFDVELDPTGSEVAIDYTFKVDTTQISQVLEANSTSNISVTGATYKIGTGESQTASIAADGTITVSESLDQVQQGQKVVVTVNLSWDNDSDSNNVSDTNEGVASYNAGANGKSIIIPVTITAAQKI